MSLPTRVKSLISQQVPSPARADQEHPLVSFLEEVQASLDSLESGVYALEPHVLSVVVTAAGAATEVEVEDTLQLTATVDVTNEADDSVTWSSSDEEVATVDSDGLVTGVAEGSVTITATSDFDESKSGSYGLDVIEAGEEEEEEEGEEN